MRRQCKGGNLAGLVWWSLRPRFFFFLKKKIAGRPRREHRRHPRRARPRRGSLSTPEICYAVQHDEAAERSRSSIIKWRRGRESPRPLSFMQAKVRPRRRGAHSGRRRSPGRRSRGPTSPRSRAPVRHGGPDDGEAGHEPRGVVIGVDGRVGPAEHVARGAVVLEPRRVCSGVLRIPVQVDEKIAVGGVVDERRCA